MQDAAQQCTSAASLLENASIHQALLHSDAAQTIVGLTLAADGTRQTVHLVLIGVDAVLVNLTDIDLHTGVILRGEEPIGDATLARDIVRLAFEGFGVWRIHN